MAKGFGSSSRARGKFERDCATCAAASRCWDDPAPAASEIRAQRAPGLDKGTTLVTQGDPFDAVYLVASGSVSLSELTVDGALSVVGFRFPGDLVGIEGWALGRHRYTAVALEPTTVCRIGSPSSDRRSGGGALLQRLLKKTARQLDASAPSWRGLPARERVAAFVEDVARRTHNENFARGPRRLPMTRAQIGSYLGLAEETVVRAMAELT
jgi:CRP/FNR family transcriptional regulator